MTDETGTPQPKRSASDPPAANQNQHEPIPTAPDRLRPGGGHRR